MPNRWSKNAEIRRYQIESGLDITFNEVFLPLYKNYISYYKPKSILEVGAGTGHMSKELSRLGYKITAIEPSEGMYEIAKEVLQKSEVELIRCIPEKLLPSQMYDFAFSHLVAHVVDDIDSFLRTVSSHLEPQGCFIFTIPHPCFYNEYKKIFDINHNYMKPLSTKITFKITKDNDNEISDVPYHHYPLSHYINSIIGAGFILKEFLEVYPSREVQMLYGFLWDKPRYCLFICYKG